jgi:transcriptional regulator with XRE-family HTH domain
MDIVMHWPFSMSISAKLVQLRKNKHLTQQQMADAVGLHVNQIKRYESGAVMPSLEALKKIVLTFGASLDELVFGKDDRDMDERLKMQLEVMSQLADEDKAIIQEVLEGLILKYQAKRWAAISKGEYS